MSTFIDLSHTFEDGMPGFKMKNEDGTITTFTAHVRPFMTHAESRPKYQGKASFEVTEMSFQTSIGTYLDSPYHRWPDRRDIGDLRLDEVILPGAVIDVRGCDPANPPGVDALPAGIDLAGRAVLFNFDWDRYWGEDAYFSYPFISRELIAALIERGVKLVGVDTLNIDSTANLDRPAHSEFLKRDILIVENLANLDALHGKSFRFFAVPIKAKATAAMPIRAFAEELA
jgi:arylformamidase